MPHVDSHVICFWSSFFHLCCITIIDDKSQQLFACLKEELYITFVGRECFHPLYSSFMMQLRTNHGDTSHRYIYTTPTKALRDAMVARLRGLQVKTLVLGRGMHNEDLLYDQVLQAQLEENPGEQCQISDLTC